MPRSRQRLHTHTCTRDRHHHVHSHHTTTTLNRPHPFFASSLAAISKAPNCTPVRESLQTTRCKSNHHKHARVCPSRPRGRQAHGCVRACNTTRCGVVLIESDEMHRQCMIEESADCATSMEAEKPMREEDGPSIPARRQRHREDGMQRVADLCRRLLHRPLPPSTDIV